jgi:hypothetical protein
MDRPSRLCGRPFVAKSEICRTKVTTVMVSETALSQIYHVLTVYDQGIGVLVLDSLTKLT